MIWKFVSEKKQAPANRRRHARHAIYRMRAELDSKVTPIQDISEIGMRVVGAPSWLAAGQGITMRLLFPTTKKDILIPLQGKVLRREGNTTIVIYNRPIDDWARSFSHLIRASDQIAV